MILPQFLSLRFLCLFPCLNLCLSKGMWRCGCVVLISSGQGAVMGGREEPERVMERGVVRHTELRPHPLKKSLRKLSKSFSVENCKKGGNPKQVIQIWKYTHHQLTISLLKTSQELQMLSRSISDCKSLTPNEKIQVLSLIVNCVTKSLNQMIYNQNWHLSIIVTL